MSARHERWRAAGAGRSRRAVGREGRDVLAPTRLVGAMPTAAGGAPRELGVAAPPRRFANVRAEVLDNPRSRSERASQPGATRHRPAHRVSTKDARAEVQAMRAQGQAERRTAVEDDITRRAQVLHGLISQASAAKPSGLVRAQPPCLAPTAHTNDSHSRGVPEDSTSTDGSADGTDFDSSHSGTREGYSAEQSPVRAHLVHARLAAAQHRAKQAEKIVASAEKRKKAAVEARQAQKKAEELAGYERRHQAFVNRAAKAAVTTPPKLPVRTMDASATSPRSPASEQPCPSARQTIWGSRQVGVGPAGRD